jgi:glycosyltransferase involved in cell wall biosynthesis
LKVLYDYQIFENQNIGGISRYFSELIKFNSESKLSLKYSENIYLKSDYFKIFNIQSHKISYENFLFNLRFKGKGRLYKYYNKIFQKNNKSISIDFLQISKFDIFHPTYYNPYFLKYLNGKPFVLTVHDMIHELFAVTDNVSIHDKRKLILSSNTIIAISENTKKDILHFYPELNEKIKVIHHGFSFQKIDDYIKKDNYILFTGMRGGYKNFNEFVKAVAPLLLKYDFTLICTGHPFTNEEKTLLDNMNISDRIIHEFATDEKLSELYSKACAFVFPSQYEGFGIPILEAFASNCPAILSNTSSMPEIGGDAAIYFDPYSIEDMRCQIERVITSTTLQNQLIEKGKERVKQFSWEKCAKETMQLYNNLLK